MIDTVDELFHNDLKSTMVGLIKRILMMQTAAEAHQTQTSGGTADACTADSPADASPTAAPVQGMCMPIEDLEHVQKAAEELQEAAVHLKLPKLRKLVRELCNIIQQLVGAALLLSS